MAAVTFELTYHIDPEPEEPRIKEGVTHGWLYLWSGKPGPARCVEVVALADDEGIVVFDEVGEWQDVTVVE